MNQSMIDGLFIPDWLDYWITLEKKSIYKSYFASSQEDYKLIALSHIVQRNMEQCGKDMISDYFTDKITINDFKEKYPNLKCRTTLVLYK